jgi:hypothetical protein
MNNKDYLNELNKDLKEIQAISERMVSFQDKVEGNYKQMIETLPESFKNDFMRLFEFAKAGNVDAVNILSQSIIEKNKTNDKDTK